MRFTYFDRVVSIEANRRMTGYKHVSVSVEFLPEHYERKALMPASLMIEALAQMCGWLTVVSRKFSCDPILVLLEGAHIRGQAQPGDRLDMSVYSEYSHMDGSTMRGELRVGETLLLTVDRMVFAHARSDDPSLVERRRERFTYLSGGFELPEELR
jgi:3-hydroxymyristoyl/3-hydroxydecanoyl-(acyl carrier protein) dehydratase